MTDTSSFDHRPDPELGDALRAALASADDPSFVRRVVAAAADADLPRSGPGRSWEVLTEWARPGLIAAGLVAVAVLAAWIGFGRPTTGVSEGLGDPLRPTVAALPIPSAFAGSPEPDVEAVLAVALGE